MVFCNVDYSVFNGNLKDVTILILVDGFLQLFGEGQPKKVYKVTILILVDGFLQYSQKNNY